MAVFGLGESLAVIRGSRGVTPTRPTRNLPYLATETCKPPASSHTEQRGLTTDVEDCNELVPGRRTGE